jgi:hypothetical protein
MMVCLIKNVRNPETRVVPIMIRILIKRISLIIAKSELFDSKKFSTAVSELPIKRGATRENILATTVIKKPRSSLVRYFKKYLFR